MYKRPMQKSNTRAEYLRRIHRAIEFIIGHLDEPVSLAQIAAASHFSPYHFHRIFHGLVGETVNDFVQRKKMERAANRLLCEPGLSVSAIADRGGFSSSANFAKAFKLYFGVSPSQLRNPNSRHDGKIGKIYRKYGKAFSVQDLYSQFDTDKRVFEPDKLKEILMNVKIVTMPEKLIAFLTAPKGYELDAIFDTWDTISGWAASMGIDDHFNKRYAICHDNPMLTPVDQCRYDACIELDKDMVVAAPYEKSRIPGGQYALARYKGEGDKVSNFYMELYSAWLPTSGFEPDNFPPVAHYLNDARQDGYVEMEVYIKVKALAGA